MPLDKSVSFRTHLLSNTTDLLADVELHCARTAKLIVSIVSQLAAYTEEGKPLAPSVFICNSIAALIQRAGVGEFVPLSGRELTETVAEKILKAAAPLCSQNWRIYVERLEGGEYCQFGVFNGSSDPSALTIDEVVLNGFEPGFPIVRVLQSVTNKVEVRTNSGSGIEFRFNDDLDVQDLSNQSRIRDLAQAIARDVTDHRQPFSAFVERALLQSIRNSHGTLIAVTIGAADILPVALQDAIGLQPPLGLYERYALHINEGKTATSVSRLQAASELVAGFVRSDGITVFNSAGNILGYRAFIHTDGPDILPTGGARTRAFAALSALVGTEFRAVLFRSQDGRMELKIAAEGPANA